MTTDTLMPLRRTRASREREMALRLGIGWVMAVGWSGGPVMIIAANDARRAEAVRKERTRVEAIVPRIMGDQAACVAEACVADNAAPRLRREVVSTLERLASRWAGYDLFDTSTPVFADACGIAAAALGVRLLTAAERAAMIEAELGRVW